ncbi:MAG: glycoside hydrolase family 28 protein [Clostridia bacterium]|nr:glycoside hydrolase family 28 protein [Clostridia bacterium]
MIKILFTSSTSACFEWQNDLPYYKDGEYEIYLDGQRACVASSNVFSLFDLTPNTKYTLTSPSFEGALEFTTKAETAAINVRDFGAVGDGVHDDTSSVQTAINCLPRGARLYFPAGTYLVAPLCMKSHITLDIPEGAVILGSPDKSRYPVIPGTTVDMVSGEEHFFGTWEGNAVPMHQALIFAEHAEDITIVGRGMINGNAPEAGWWIDVKNHPFGRPRLMFFNRCDGIRVHGIHACDAASWQMHPYFSSNVDFLDMFISAPKDSPNTDAIDPEACDRVDIIGCRFSVGDDCIAIKSGKIDIGRKFKKPANRHTIRNCLMEFGHGAITLGSEMAGGVTNLTVNRCVFRQTDRGLRIKSRRGRGKDAVIDGVVFENIKMEGVLTPIVMNMWYNCCDPDRNSEYVWSRKALPVDDRTPYLGKFTFKNMICEDCEAAACYCDGLPERPIEEINIENITFTFSPNAKPARPAMREFMEEFCRVGMYFDNVKRLVISNVKLDGVIGDHLIIDHIGELVQK